MSSVQAAIETRKTILNFPLASSGRQQILNLDA